MYIRLNYIYEKHVEVEMYCLKDDEKKDIIDDIKNTFHIDSVIFRATGLWNNISEVIDYFKNYKIKVYEGDKNKLFVRKYPEVIVEIEDIELIDKTLEFYTNVIYEGRYLYFFKKENKQEVEKIIENYKYHDHNLFAFLGDKVDCLIENMRECEDSSSYSIIIKKTYLKNIKIINSYLNL